jgi:hypothetical protein
MSTYDPHELKIVRRGVSVDKVIAAYKHFGSLRKAAAVCAISKDTVKAVILRFDVARPTPMLPAKASYNPRTHYSTFAKWHQAHASDKALPNSVSALAKLSGVPPNVVKCYFYRRRREARKLLESLADLRKLSLSLEDIEGKTFPSSALESYHFAIDRYAQRAAIQGIVLDITSKTYEVTVLIPSIDVFASRIRKLTSTKSKTPVKDFPKSNL